jgi:hypothetical protein
MLSSRQMVWEGLTGAIGETPASDEIQARSVADAFLPGMEVTEVAALVPRVYQGSGLEK